MNLRINHAPRTVQCERVNGDLSGKTNNTRVGAEALTPIFQARFGHIMWILPRAGVTHPESDLPVQ
jgi:hypothetical protein